GGGAGGSDPSGGRPLRHSETAVERQPLRHSETAVERQPLRHSETAVERQPLRHWESAVDRQIREAQERGAFDDLPGAGHPLPREPWEGDWALAHHVLKLAGETLPWISLGRDIDAAHARLQAMLRDAVNLGGGERLRARERYLH